MPFEIPVLLGVELFANYFQSSLDLCETDSGTARQVGGSAWLLVLAGGNYPVALKCAVFLRNSLFVWGPTSSF